MASSGSPARPGDQPRDIVVIGASAGGIEALRAVLREVRRGSGLSIFVVIHISAEAPSVLPQIAQKWTDLVVTSARHGDRVLPDHVYVAPPDHHLQFLDGHIFLTRGPKENRVRPAVDTLFRSAAELYGDRVVGVVLSGNLDDGSAGLERIKANGGLAIAQDPVDLVFPGMPQSAIARVDVDYILPAEGIGRFLAKMNTMPGEGIMEREGPLRPEAERGEELESVDEGGEVYTCPDCNGPLRRYGAGAAESFICRVGHRYSLVSLLAEQYEAFEKALWVAVRTLEERAELWERMAERSRTRKRDRSASRFDELAKKSADSSRSIRDIMSIIRTGAEDMAQDE